jgi:hypothetical protein
MDRTNLERQRRWQARHMIKPTQSPEEIAERLRDVLDREKMERVATLLGATGGGVNNASDDGQADTEQADDGVNNAPKLPDSETLRMISDLPRTFKPAQLRFICAALMRRLKIKSDDGLVAENAELRKKLDDANKKLRETTAEVADEGLQRKIKSLQMRLNKAEASSRGAWDAVDKLKSASPETVIMTDAQRRAVMMCLHPDRTTASVDKKHLDVAMTWFNGLNVVKHSDAA